MRIEVIPVGNLASKYMIVRMIGAKLLPWLWQTAAVSI
jgi:hypothetical protein